MQRKLKIGNLTWIDSVDLNQDEIKNILEPYNFHELDVEACLEGNQKARIDEYSEENYSFLIFHFPKYNTIRKIYELNEFNIFLGKDFLITFRDFHGQNVDNIFDYYNNSENIEAEDEKIKISTAYILYEIIQAMLEKMFKVSRVNNREIKKIENAVFEKDDYSLAKNIMIKKRNIMLIRNMFKPQVLFFRQLENVINKMYAGEMEIYFEDLEDKIDQILNEFIILQEYIDSVEDTFKTMLDIKTNSVIKVLTIFSAFMLPLTLITSFYGMNIKLPLQENIFFVYILLFCSIIFMIGVYIYMKIKGKI